MGRGGAGAARERRGQARRRARRQRRPRRARDLRGHSRHAHRRAAGGVHRRAVADPRRRGLARTRLQRPGGADRRRAADPRQRAPRRGRLADQPGPPGACRAIRSSPGSLRSTGWRSLVRGQKLPIFSVGGLPHLELASQIAAQASVRDEPFAVVFAAMGLTHADASAVRDTLEERSAHGDLALLLNTADDPTVERLVTPRIALTVAEHLAFDLGRHVLVVMADLTSYCEALREVSSARGEVPSRRGYPGYLYSDLASLLERAGRIEGVAGSLTQLPVLTMPAGDITHPVPDVVGYITEGQIVLAPELERRGVYPPFDALGSLSRLMRLGAGPGRDARRPPLDLLAALRAGRAGAPGRRPRRDHRRGRAVGSGAALPRVLAGVRAGVDLSQRRDEVAYARRDARPRLERRLAAASPRSCRWSRPTSSATTTVDALRIPPGRAGRRWLAEPDRHRRARPRPARREACGVANRDAGRRDARGDSR